MPQIAAEHTNRDNPRVCGLTCTLPRINKIRSMSNQGSKLQPIQSNLQLILVGKGKNYLEKSQICDLFFLCFFETKRLPVTNLLLLKKEMTKLFCFLPLIFFQSEDVTSFEHGVKYSCVLSIIRHFQQFL